ncbi:MAG: type II toxin-antitoxin system RelE/ParE family toxin [Providencia sp.]|nr:type II toxin-antitoxin system RelE/ParE family toxin [Providencia sp.]
MSFLFVRGEKSMLRLRRSLSLANYNDSLYFALWRCWLHSVIQVTYLCMLPEVLLKGNREGYWSITVRANWCINFQFIKGDTYILNYEDYH